MAEEEGRAMEQRTLVIDAALYERAAAAVKRLGFESVEAYVSHLLREHLARVEVEEGEVFSETEEEEVKERLRALGYLD
jgi:hypothetical protein